ncbi:sensor histidine kinase [Oharaeibacter diazotrophicus]|uniref:histidine kinase n=1 Tax=Oharaeibacter diazotrophicus TaxID=1920512 RepID=A0A4R6RLH8_9HYPH|nr:ATP-binding protein [Oharaeibacter diazotrophicus]TDP86965.1 two-component system sensor histidine kinase HupT/HoxJ [Oharaeibacter diazotrophicus]BBE71092.1 sensor histidine kinase TmoS [Pleomorphomonas sp. SM30]GLS77844.1 PAS domain-containing sensor histidine kinase [Oharaeibacter diazotrophicus]
MPTEKGRPDRLLDHVAGPGTAALDGAGEAMWLDVIAKMDEVYSDLLRYETDLEAKNSELEEAQAFISSVIASVSDILVVVDAAGRIVQVNPAFVRLTGVSEAEIVGSALAARLAPADRDAAAGIAGAAQPSDRELRFLTRDGVSDLMAVASSPRLDHAGRRAGAVLTGRPIGELRRAYEALHRAHQELQQAQRKLVEQEKMASLGRLVAGVAHELNNPISFVYGNIHTLDRYRTRLTGYLDALHRGGDPDELRRSHRIDAVVEDLAPLIEGTLEGAVRIADIVRNLRRLSFTRPGDRRPVDLERLVRTAATWAAKAKGDAVAISVSAEPGATAEGQEGQLHQVVVNLIENAIDAVRGRPDPRVEVSVGAAGPDMVEIRVADNGPGVAPEIADKIFEPFFTTKTVGEGTGLGLWISYSIAREHGGELALAPSAEGAAFALRLPRGRAEPDAGA